jgi:hypothetical protein
VLDHPNSRGDLALMERIFWPKSIADLFEQQKSLDLYR